MRRSRHCGARAVSNLGSTAVRTSTSISTSIRPRSSRRRRRTSRAVSCCAPSDAPLVYVTMGTVFNDPAPLVAVVAAVSELDVRVLVTVGPRADPAALGSLPANARVERYVAQGRVLQHCSVVVSHAGSGTVLSTLTLGLPQLCLPQGADQFLNADAVAVAGAGISLTPDETDPDAFRDAVARLLDDRSFRDAAGRVSASIVSMPSPDEVAAVLETLD